MKLKHVFLNENFIVRNLEKAPSQFKTDIKKLINRHNVIQEFDPNADYTTDEVFIEFARGGLSSDDNTVVIGNKFHDKKSQYSKLKNKVNTIKTYTDALRVAGKEFIAKKNIGQRQQGQLINELPDNPEEYIFQNLIDIVAEFRVIVYYMNGQYQVSGIYKKTGSNVSISQIPSDSGLGKVISKMAIKATRILGYGFGGVDIAVVGAGEIENIVMAESVLGSITSKATKALGRIQNMDELLDNHYPVILEVNSMPSMSNPAILHDLLKSLEKTRYK